MSKTEPFSHREGEDAVWNGLVIRSVETYGKIKKKKVERISCSRPVYDRSCCIFGDFGMLLDTIQYNCHVGGREIYSTFHASYFWNRQFRKGYFFKSDAGIGNNACDQHIGRPFSTVAGVLLGAFTGYFGGILDEILMRITDAVNGFPSILLTLVIISLLGKGRQNVIIALGIVFIPSFVRIVRGEFLRLRDADYIKRARLMGVSRLRILFVHILPNIFPCCSFQ